VTYAAIHLDTVSRLSALTLTGSAVLFLALMANFLLPVLWIMFVYSSHLSGYHAESYKTAHIVELDSGTTKSELRGHDNVVEAAVFAPVSCLPAIRELLGQKVLSYFSPLITTLLNLFYSQQQHRAAYLTMRTSPTL
jgi:hypothetical protein